MSPTSNRLLWLACGFALFCPAQARSEPADAEIFSGPQVGEELAGFKALGAYDNQAGKEIDLVEEAAGKPILLVFMHDPATRPSAALTRGLSVFAWEHRERLAFAIIWLKDDRSEAGQFLRRARNSLNFKGPVAISLDGAEGPGAYGLNRNAGLTVLVAEKNQVAANFALVQPATTDGPPILAQVVKLIGGEVPSQEAFDELCYGGARYRGRDEPADGAIPRSLLVPVISKRATEKQVLAAAEKVEQYVDDHPARQKELGRIAKTVVDSGKLADYGTPPAREKLKEWAAKYGKKSDEPPAPESTRPEKADQEDN
jgi:hypothetical protein